MMPHATPDATKLYADNCWRANPHLSPNSWRLWEGLMASKLYQTDTTQFAEWFGAGCNVWLVKHHQAPLVSALGQQIADISRDQLILHGAGGFIAAEAGVADAVTVTPAVSHTLNGAVLRQQILDLCEWLGVERLESFMLLQPELHKSAPDFTSQLTHALTALEQACADGLIGCYGIQSPAFVLPLEDERCLDLAQVWDCAQNAAQQAWERRKRPLLRLIQLPMSLLQLQALKQVNTQAASFGGKTISVTCLELAARLHIAALADAPLRAGAVDFTQPQTVPPQLAQELMTRLPTDWHTTTLPAIALNAIASVPNIIGVNATGATLADMLTIQRLGDFADVGAVLGTPTESLANAA